MLSELDADLETAAKQAAGNWKKWPSFVWDLDSEPDADRRYLINTMNRDADILTQSNHAAIRKALAKFTGGTHPSVRTFEHSHWAVGWTGGFDVLVYDRRGNITGAFRAIHEIACALSDYPILDDDDHSERTLEAAWETLRLGCESYLTDSAPGNWVDQVKDWLDANGSAFERIMEDPENASIDADDAKAALKALGLLDPSYDNDSDDTNARP